MAHINNNCRQQFSFSKATVLVFVTCVLTLSLVKGIQGQQDNNGADFTQALIGNLLSGAMSGNGQQDNGHSTAPATTGFENGKNPFMHLLNQLAQANLLNSKKKVPEPMILSTGWVSDIINIFDFPVIDAGKKQQQCEECVQEYMEVLHETLNNQTVTMCANPQSARAPNGRDFCDFHKQHSKEAILLMAYFSHSDPVRQAMAGCIQPCGQLRDPYALDVGIHVVDGVVETIRDFVHSSDAVMPDPYEWVDEEIGARLEYLPEVANLTCTACLSDTARDLGERVTVLIKDKCNNVARKPTEIKYCEWANDHPRAAVASALYIHQINPLHTAFAMCATPKKNESCDELDFLETGPSRETCSKYITNNSFPSYNVAQFCRKRYGDIKTPEEKKAELSDKIKGMIQKIDSKDEEKK